MNGIEHGAAASGFILTLTQTIKACIPKTWYDWFLPLLALVLGVVYRTWLEPTAGYTMAQMILEGIRDGAAAIGIFSIGKKTKDTATAVLSGKKESQAA